MDEHPAMKSELADADRANKVIEEGLPIKVLAERHGLLVAVTTKTYSHLLFLSRPLVGYRKILTGDFIVARAGYDIRKTRDLIDLLYGPGGL